jgi:malonate-semialdehyde dehydrogenase (acetylating)/methylmalonate-semialdehyde dehydrogenase
MLRLGARRSAGFSRHYATAVGGQPKAPLSGLNDAVKARAEGLSNWKGTSATGEKTKNYIGGQFVDSGTSQWLDVVDPVS